MELFELVQSSALLRSRRLKQGFGLRWRLDDSVGCCLSLFETSRYVLVEPVTAGQQHPEMKGSRQNVSAPKFSASWSHGQCVCHDTMGLGQ